MNLTTEAAKVIIAAFGPCTSLYECTSPEELVERFIDTRRRDPEETVNAFLATLLTVEGVVAERMDETGACYREWKAAKPAVVAGLTALGYTVTK